MFDDRIEQVDTASTKPQKIEAQLNALGQGGRELVSVAPDFDGVHILKAFLKRRTGARTLKHFLVRLRLLSLPRLASNANSANRISMIRGNAVT